VKSLSRAKKSFRIFRKLSGRSIVTRPRHADENDIKKAKEGKPEVADHRHLYAILSLPILPPKWRMISGRAPENLLRPMACWLKWFIPLFTGSEAFQEVRHVGNQTALLGDEEGAIENLWGNHSDDRHGFLTILDYVLTVGESAGGGERAGHRLILTQEAS
jgi:hypothetical protein